MRRKDDEKQKSIKKAVIKLILEEGFHGASISKIAKEAGVSPATVYIYYENKDAMLQDIYVEYSEDIFCYLLSNINMNMDGRQLIEILIRNYYTYIQENKDIFHFVQQFSSCPALANQCRVKRTIHSIYNLFDDMKERKMIKNFRNDNIWAVLSSPVKTISNNHFSCDKDREEMLKEMVTIIQDALIL